MCNKNCAAEEVIQRSTAEALCNECSAECVSLSSITFHESSSLKLIGKDPFLGAGVAEIRITDGVEEPSLLQ